MTEEPSNEISIDPDVSVGAHGDIKLSGSVDDLSGVSEVEVTARIDGYERHLGTATVDADGGFSFADPIRGHFQAFITISATDAAGQTLSTQAPFTLQGPFGPGYDTFEQDTYSADGSALLASTFLSRDGSRLTKIDAPGQTFVARHPDTFDLVGTRDTTLAFADGSGRNVVFGFRTSGRGHDTIDLSNVGITDAQDLLGRITMRGGHAVIHLPSGEVIVLRGVTKAQIARHLDDFSFANQPPPPPAQPTPIPPSPEPTPSPAPVPNRLPTITVADPAPVTDAAPGTPAPVTVRVADAVTISDPDAGDAPVPYAGGLNLRGTTGPAPASGNLASLFTVDPAAGTVTYDRSAFAYLSRGQSVTATFGFNSASGPDALPETVKVEVDGTDQPPTITVADPAPVADAAPGTPAPVTVRVADAVTISDPDAGDAPVPYAGGLNLRGTTGPAPASGNLASLFTVDPAAGTVTYDRSAFAYLSRGQSVTATFGFNSASGPDALPETVKVEVDGTDQLPTVTVTNPAPTLATTTSSPAPVTVAVASAVAVSDPDVADAAKPYAGGLALQSTTGPAPASGNLASLFTVDPVAGTITYDRSAFAYLLKGQSVTATFDFHTVSGPDTLSEALTVEVDGANVPSAAPVFHLASSDASVADANGTAASTVTLAGTGTPGDTVALSGSTAASAPTTVVAADGTFRFVDVGLASGDNPLSASASHYGTAPATASTTVTRSGSTTSDNVATVWNRLALTAIAGSAVDPEIASRALAMESLAVYNAVSAIDGTPGFLFDATAPADASAEAAVAQAAHDVLVAQFPSQKGALDAALARSLGAIPDGASKSDGIALGASVAATEVAQGIWTGWLSGFPA